VVDQVRGAHAGVGPHLPPLPRHPHAGAHPPRPPPDAASSNPPCRQWARRPRGLRRRRRDAAQTVVRDAAQRGLRAHDAQHPGLLHTHSRELSGVAALAASDQAAEEAAAERTAEQAAEARDREIAELEELLRARPLPSCPTPSPPHPRAPAGRIRSQRSLRGAAGPAIRSSPRACADDWCDADSVVRVLAPGRRGAAGVSGGAARRGRARGRGGRCAE